MQSIKLPESHTLNSFNVAPTKINVPFFIDTKELSKEQLVELMDLFEKTFETGYFLNSRETTEEVLFENHDKANDRFSFDKSYLGIHPHTKTGKWLTRAYSSVSDIGCTIYAYDQLLEMIDLLNKTK